MWNRGSVRSYPTAAAHHVNILPLLLLCLVLVSVTVVKDSRVEGVAVVQYNHRHHHTASLLHAARADSVTHSAQGLESSDGAPGVHAGAAAEDDDNNNDGGSDGGGGGGAHDRMAVVHDTSATLAQCVLITFAGYIAARLQLLNEQQLQGIEKFTSNFALPALMFTNMAALDLQEMHIDLICGIFMAKAVVLLAVISAGCLLSDSNGRPWNVIGLYGIFATMCNDFGIALPVLQSLYGPALASELYLIAPLSLCILNPVCLYLMEYHRHMSSVGSRRPLAACHGSRPDVDTASTSRASEFSEPVAASDGSRHDIPRSRLSVLARVVLRTVFHPHVFVCLLGLFFNLTAWHSRLPAFVDSSLQVTGDSFASLILFLLGFRLDPQSDHPKSQMRQKLSVITLSIMKTVALPILCLLGVRLLGGSLSLSNFAFIYGAVPTPPLVTVYAVQYSINSQEISAAVCVSSILSLPVLFVASKATALTIAQPDLSDYTDLGSSLVPGVLGLAAINLLCALFVIVYLTALSSRHTRLPFHFLLCLCLSQIFQSLGVLFWHIPHFVLPVYPVCFITAGQMSGRFFLAFFATSVSPSIGDSPKFLKLKRSLTLMGFGVPAGATLVMYIWAGPAERLSAASAYGSAITLPLFLNGHVEAVVFACLLSFSLCAVFGALLDVLFRETGLSAPMTPKRHRGGGATAGHSPSTASVAAAAAGPIGECKASHHQAKHMLALVCLSGSALVGLVHTYWRISDGGRADRPLVMAVEFLDGYMTFSQAAVIMLVYAIHSKYYHRAERFIYASKAFSVTKQAFRRPCSFVSSTLACSSVRSHSLHHDNQDDQSVQIKLECVTSFESSANAGDETVIQQVRLQPASSTSTRPHSFP